MKRHFSFFILAFFVFWAASVVVASAENDGCKLQGSWISYDDNGVPTWMASIYGQSNSSGTAELEYPAEFPKVPTPDGPLFPNAVGMTQLRGAWERTGGNTFDYTVLGYGYDENGVPLWIGRMSESIEIVSEDCNTGVFGAALYVYPCDGGICPNPYGEAPIVFDDEIPPSYGYRVTVD